MRERDNRVEPVRNSGANWRLIGLVIVPSRLLRVEAEGLPRQIRRRLALVV